MSPPGARLLLTGASGFIGRHVAQAIGRAPAVAGLRVLVHRSEPVGLPAGAELVAGDVADPASLRGLCTGVDAVVHAATWVGDDAATCDRVNAHGTAALVAEAERAGVRRLVYLSTAAVYGWAVHECATESEARPDPATPMSRSRVAAERAVLAAGGSVLRPLFVYGEGDTRFLPAIMRAQRRFPFLVGGGRARLSVVAAGELGEAAAALALMPPGPATSGAFHVSEAEPTTYAEIVGQLGRLLDLPVPRLSVPYGVARWLVRAVPAHQLFLVARDHYYDASRLRATLGRSPGPGIRERLPALLPWYRRFADERRVTAA